MTTVAQPTLEPHYETTMETIVYGQGKVVVDDNVTEMDLLLDLYQPVNAPSGQRPAILMIHGGGYLSGERTDPNLVKAAKEYTARGYIAVSMGYRLAKQNPVPSKKYQELLDMVKPIDNSWAEAFGVSEDQFEAVVPSAMEDTQMAIDWLVANTEMLSLDRSRITLFGASAGAITALNVAYMSNNIGLGDSQVAALIDCWGGFVFAPDSSALEMGEAPIFIVHGTADNTVPFKYSEALVKQAKATGVYYEFYPLEGYGHGFSQIDIMTVEVDRKTLYQRSVEFLDNVLFHET